MTDLTANADAIRDLTRAAVQRYGDRRVLEATGLSSGCLSRVLGGQNIRRGTLAVLTLALPTLAASENEAAR